MSTRVSRKRAREDSPSQEGSPVKKRSETVEPRLQEDAGNGHGDGVNMKRDEEYWSEDGTVTLVARDVEFQVYSGILASNSPVFRDLFARQDHPTRIVSMNGRYDIPCPVVQLTDTPEDLRHLLRAYIPQGDVSFLNMKWPSFHVISASIRLGRKYKRIPLYEESLSYLKKHYTNDFSDWVDSNVETGLPEDWAFAEAIGVANLARLIAEPTLLPTAIMECTDLGKEIVRGFEREDGSQEYLTPEDLGICFLAKSALREASIQAVLLTFQPIVSLDCKTPSTCRDHLQSALSGLHAYARLLIRHDPFLSWKSLVKDYRLDVCLACMKALDHRSRVERVKVWNRLPEILGIDVPGWLEPEPVP